MLILSHHLVNRRKSTRDHSQPVSRAKNPPTNESFLLWKSTKKECSCTCFNWKHSALPEAEWNTRKSVILRIDPWTVRDIETEETINIYLRNEGEIVYEILPKRLPQELNIENSDVISKWVLTI